MSGAYSTIMSESTDVENTFTEMDVLINVPSGDHNLTLTSLTFPNRTTNLTSYTLSNLDQIVYSIAILLAR